jgi:hypothetical protein
MIARWTLYRLGGQIAGGEWAVENVVKINSGKGKAVSFTRARVKDRLNYLIGDQRIPEASSCKYLGIIYRIDLTFYFNP